jgi:Protein of unknown function (DUF1579)
MKFGYVMSGVVCAGLVLGLGAASAQDGKGGNTKKPPANNKPAATKPAGNQAAAKPPATPAPKPAAPAPAPAPTPAPAAVPADAAPPAAAADGKGLLAKAAMPGAHHKPLMDLKGNWNLAVTSTADPGATPVQSTATSAFAIIMDGRYIVESTVGTGPMGPFNGMGIYGFNVIGNEYENVWLDNTSTAMWKSTGTWDDATQSFRWHGEMVSVKNGGKAKTQAIMKKVSDTRYEYTMLEERGEKLFKSLEIVYTKA